MGMRLHRPNPVPRPPTCSRSEGFSFFFLCTSSSCISLFLVLEASSLAFFSRLAVSSKRRLSSRVSTLALCWGERAGKSKPPYQPRSQALVEGRVAWKRSYHHTCQCSEPIDMIRLWKHTYNYMNRFPASTRFFLVYCFYDMQKTAAKLRLIS